MEQFWELKFGELLEQGQQCIDQCLNVLQSRESSQRYGVEQQFQQQQKQLEKVSEENFVILSHDEAIRGFITFMGDTITGGGLTIKLDHHSLHGHHHHIGTSKPKVIQLTFAPLNNNSSSRQASSNGSVDDADATINYYNNKQSSSLDNLNQNRGWQVDQISDCISLLQLLERKLKYQNSSYIQCQQSTKGATWNIQQRMQMLEELLDLTTIILQTAQSGKEYVVKTHGLRYSSAKQFYSRVFQNSESLPLKSMIIDFYIDDGRLMLSVKHIEAVQNSHPPSQYSVSYRKQRQSSITESGIGGSSSSLSSQFQDALQLRGSSSHSNLSSYGESTAMHKQDHQDRNGHQVPQKQQQQVSAKNGHSSHHLNPLDSLRSALQHHNQPSQTQQQQQQKSSNKTDGSNLEKAKSQSQPKSFFARLSSNYLGVPQPQHHQNSIAIHGGRQQSSGGSHVKQSSDEGKRSASAIPFGSHQLNHHQQQQQQLNKTPSGNNLKLGGGGGTSTPIDLASVTNGQNKSQTSSQTHLAPNIEPAAAVKRERGSSSSTKSALVQMFAPFQHIIAPVKQPRQIFNYDGQKVQLLHEDTVECKCSEEKSNYQCVIECIEDLQMSYRDLLKSLVQYHKMQQHIQLNHSQKESL